MLMNLQAKTGFTKISRKYFSEKIFNRKMIIILLEDQYNSTFKNTVILRSILGLDNDHQDEDLHSALS